MITFEFHGDFKNTDKFLKAMRKENIYQKLDSYGREGARALASHTPVDTGKTADSWGYEVDYSRGSATIIWTNNNVEMGRPVAIMLQYGHGTGTGGYVQGRDYINPAMKPIFDKIAQGVWRVVTTA